MKDEISSLGSPTKAIQHCTPMCAHTSGRGCPAFDLSQPVAVNFTSNPEAHRDHQHDPLGYLRHPVASVARRCGDQLHHGRIYSHLPGGSCCGVDLPDYIRPANRAVTRIKCRAKEKAPTRSAFPQPISTKRFRALSA